MYKKIMLAMDGSSCSEAALKEAINIANTFNSTVIIINVVDINDEIIKASPGLLDQLIVRAKKIVKNAKEKMDEAHIKSFAFVKEGDPHKTIPQMANEENVDLIVLGTYGRKGLRLLLMGSVVEETICQANCDVLIVNERMYTKGKYQSILVPYDGSKFSEIALKRACQMVKINQGEILVFYVIPRYEEVLEFFKTSWMKEILMREAETIIKSAQEIAFKEGILIKTKIEPEDHVDVRIVETAKQFKIDIIIMGARGLGNLDRIIIGSVVRGVIVNAPCPVLIAKGA